MSDFYDFKKEFGGKTFQERHQDVKEVEPQNTDYQDWVKETGKYEKFNPENPNLENPYHREYIKNKNIEDRSEFTRGLLSGIDDTQGMLYGAAGMLGSLTKIDSLRDWGFKNYKRNLEEAELNPVSVNNIKDIHGINDLGDWFAGTLGGLAPTMAEIAASAGIGAFMGSAATPAGSAAGGIAGAFNRGMVKAMLKKKLKQQLGSKALTKLAEKEGLEAATRIAKKKVGQELGRDIGLVLGSSALESGGMWTEEAEKYGTEKANPWSSLGLGLVSGATELVAPSGTVVRRALGLKQAVKGLTKAEASKIIKNAGTKRFVGTLLKSVGGAAGKEGVQEVTQELISTLNGFINDPSMTAGDLLSPENINKYTNAFAGGAAAGLLFGAGEGASKYRASKAGAKDVLQKDQEQTNAVADQIIEDFHADGIQDKIISDGMDQSFVEYQDVNDIIQGANDYATQMTGEIKSFSEKEEKEMELANIQKKLNNLLANKKPNPTQIANIKKYKTQINVLQDVIKKSETKPSEELQMEQDILAQREAEKARQEELNTSPTQAELNQAEIDKQWNATPKLQEYTDTLNQMPADTLTPAFTNENQTDQPVTPETIAQATTDIEEEIRKAKEELPQAPDQNPQDLLNEYNRSNEQTQPQQEIQDVTETDFGNIKPDSEQTFVPPEQNKGQNTTLKQDETVIEEKKPKKEKPKLTPEQIIIDAKRDLGIIKRYPTLSENPEQEMADLKKTIAEAEKKLPKFQTSEDQDINTSSLKDIASRFKGQEVTIKDNSVHIKFKNGKTLQITKVKDIGNGDYELAVKTGRMSKDGVILGKYQDGKITLNKNLASNFTKDHELYHALKDYGMIAPRDVFALKQEFNKLRKKNKLNFRISNHKENSIAREENEANTFAQILKDREKYRGTRLGKLIQKVTDFLNGLLHIGRQSVVKLAKEVESGKVFEREAKKRKTTTPKYEQTAQKWYSAFQNAVESVSQKAMPAKAWIDLINSNKFKQLGVKQEEIEWTGVKDWLAEQKGKVTKKDVVDYVRENNVKLREVNKNRDYLPTASERGTSLGFEVSFDEDENAFVAYEPGGSIMYTWGGDLIKGETENEVWTEIEPEINNVDVPEPLQGNTKFSEYQLPGGENYQELLITIPNNDYQGQHWDEPGVIVHVRTTDRDVNGKKILHIEEVQSDFAQEGRKIGYGEEVRELAKLNEHFQKYRTTSFGFMSGMSDQANKDIIAMKKDPKFQRYQELQKKDSLNEIKRGVPNQPFKKSKTWGLLAIKRMVRYAAENGYDGIAITQGAEQVERYKSALRKAVDKIEWTKTKDGIQLVGYKDGKQVVDTTEKENSVSDAIGKSMGDSIIADKNQSGTIEGDDITISDTGMAGFYDKILPSAINKFFNKKAWGKAKVGEISINTDDGKYNLHYLPITPEMKEKSLREGMPMFQAQEDLDNKAFDMPDNSSFLDMLKTGIVNSLYPIEKVYKAIGKKIPEKIDFLLKEKLRISKTKDKIDKANEKYVEPIKKLIGENNLTIENVDEALYARHAPEANERLRYTNARHYLKLLAKEQKGKDLEKQITQIDKDFTAQNAPSIEIQHQYRELLESEVKKNPTLKASQQWKRFSEKPSGMTDDTAKTLNKKWADNKAMKQIFSIFDEMNKEKLKISYEAGRMTKEEYEAIKGTFDYYAPLYREGFDGKRAFKGIGSGVTNLGTDFKVRGGSTKKAVHILANAIIDHEKTIIRSEKAKVAKAFIDFVKEHPNKYFWNFERPASTSIYDIHGNIRKVPAYTARDTKGEVEVKVNGETYIVAANPNNDTAVNIIETIKGTDANSGPVVNALSKFNRILAAVNTTLNPEFVLSNFARDFQTGLANLSDTDIKKKRIEVIKNLPKALKGLKDLARGKGSSEWAKIAKEYTKSGGKIGWIDYGKDIESKAKKLERQINLYRKGHRTQKLATATMKFIEDYNSIVENGVRLSAYKTAIDSGMSKSKAAMLAKELTVNFNQKGKYGQVINSLYLFANAGIQGSTRMFRMFKNNPKAGAKIAGSIITAGAATALANSALAGDDDNGDNYYDQVDDYIKKRNMVFMIPGTKGKYIKIPLPWGYNVFWALGTELADSQTQKGYRKLEGASRMVSTTLDAFNPLQSASMLQMISPTITDPFAMVGENKTFYGSPLMPDRNIFAKVKKPDSERYWKSAREPSKFVARELNKITGGNKVKSGLVDVSPETLDLIWDTFTGGAGRFASDTLGLPLNATKDDLSIKRIPGVRRLLGEKSEYKTSSDFRKNKDHVYTLHAEIKEYPGNKTKIEKDRTFQLYTYLKNTEKQIRKLNKIMKNSKNENYKKNLKIKIDKLQSKFNQKFNNKLKGV